jgi:hypothetical protein
VQLEQRARNNVHMWSNLQSDNKVAPGHNKAFDPSSRIEFIKKVIVGHVWGLFQALESLFPLNPTIIMQGIPNDLSCFLNEPLQIIENRIISLVLVNPQDTASKKTRCN